MKTTRQILVIAFACMMAFISCKKFEDQTAGYTNQASQKDLKSIGQASGPLKEWREDFTIPFSLVQHWTLFGTPQPQWIESAYGRTGLFDNNGPSPTKNFAVSHSRIGEGSGYSVESEVLVKIINPEGTCVCPGIGVSKELDPSLKNGEIETGISMRLIYAGTDAIWFPQSFRGHTWLVMDYMSSHEYYQASLSKNVDYLSNTWHTMKIVVLPTLHIRFYLDNALVWAPVQALHPMMAGSKNVVLGYTSSGNPATRAGVAYHNWVKTSFPLATCADD